MRTIELKANIPLKIKKILKNSYKELKIPYQKFRVYDKPKIFCIGLNKTGTTSLKMEMLELGFVTGDQRKAELLVEDWAKRDFSRLVKYCQTAQFFQDVPFSYPFTFIPMDQALPRSKFILTIRRSAEEWYHSLIQFHGKLWGNGNVPPTAEDLKNATYLYKGRPYRTRKLVHQ
ncbi:MAG: sulfotransferase, partial [bacterium]